MLKSGVTWMLWFQSERSGKRKGTASHHGALGGGEVDGVDASGQSLLQVVEDVGADAGAGRGALGGRGFVQELLEAVEFDQEHHVLQEIAFDESGELRGTEELEQKRVLTACRCLRQIDISSQIGNVTC